MALVGTLVLTVMVFRNTPTRLVSYLTMISPFSPGAMGSSGFFWDGTTTAGPHPFNKQWSSSSIFENKGPGSFASFGNIPIVNSLFLKINHRILFLRRQRNA